MGERPQSSTGNREVQHLGPPADLSADPSEASDSGPIFYNATMPFALQADAGEQQELMLVLAGQMRQVRRQVRAQRQAVRQQRDDLLKELVRFCNNKRHWY